MIVAALNLILYAMAIWIALRDGDASIAKLYDSIGLWFSVAIVAICWRLNKIIEALKEDRD